MIVNLFGDIRVVIESVDIDLYDSSERKIVLYVNDLQDDALEKIHCLRGSM